MPNFTSHACNRDALTLRELVERYCCEERAAGRRKYEVHGLYRPDSILDDANAEVRDSPGCYAIYDDQHRMRYIGMSKEAIGYRSISHFAKRVRESDFWRAKPPHYVDLVPTSQPWEAPSLEAYLTLNTDQMRNEED